MVMATGVMLMSVPEPVAALRLRLCVTSHPPGVEPGVIDFTAFGPVTAPATAP